MSIIEEQRKAKEREERHFKNVDRSQDLFAEGKITIDQMLKVESDWKKSVDELREINEKIEKEPQEVAQDNIESEDAIETEYPRESWEEFKDRIIEGAKETYSDFFKENQSKEEKK